MSLFEMLGNKGGQMSREQAMQQLRANPAQVLRQAGLNLPQGMTDPQQMVMYLMRSGQIGRNFRRIGR